MSALQMCPIAALMIIPRCLKRFNHQATGLSAHYVQWQANQTSECNAQPNGLIIDVLIWRTVMSADVWRSMFDVWRTVMSIYVWRLTFDVCRWNCSFYGRCQLTFDVSRLRDVVWLARLTDDVNQRLTFERCHFDVWRCRLCAVFGQIDVPECNEDPKGQVPVETYIPPDFGSALPPTVSLNSSCSMSEYPNNASLPRPHWGASIPSPEVPLLTWCFLVCVSGLELLLSRIQTGRIT